MIYICSVLGQTKAFIWLGITAGPLVMDMGGSTCTSANVASLSIWLDPTFFFRFISCVADDKKNSRCSLGWGLWYKAAVRATYSHWITAQLGWRPPGCGVSAPASTAPTNQERPLAMWGEDQTRRFWLEWRKYHIFSPCSLFCTICRKVLFLLQEGSSFLLSPNVLQNTNSAFYWFSWCAVLNKADL